MRSTELSYYVHRGSLDSHLSALRGAKLTTVLRPTPSCGSLAPKGTAGRGKGMSTSLLMLPYPEGSRVANSRVARQRGSRGLLCNLAEHQNLCQRS